MIAKVLIVFFSAEWEP